MAVVVRMLICLVIGAGAYAQESAVPIVDSLSVDSVSAVISDSIFASSGTAESGWLIPIAIIAASAGLFVFLFSARTKS